jgi:hypothetical protein
MAPNCFEYLILLLTKVIPALAQQQQNQQQPHVKILQDAVIGIVFGTYRGIYIPTKNHEKDTTGGFVVMPDIQEDPYSPLTLEEWTFLVRHDDYESLQSCGKEWQSTLVPQSIQECGQTYYMTMNGKNKNVGG